MTLQLKPNKLFYRRDGQIAGPFVEEDYAPRKYPWHDVFGGLWYKGDGTLRWSSPGDKADIVAEAPEAELTFGYRNWRGEIGVRRIRPGRTIFAATAWHPEKQWLLEGFDLDKIEPRTFAMKDILFWGAQPPMAILRPLDEVDLDAVRAAQGQGVIVYDAGDAEMEEGRRRIQILSANEKIHRCKFCGDWTEDDPSDQVRPADGCSHYLDLDAAWASYREASKWTEDQLKSPHTQRHIRDISDKPSTVDTQALEAMARISRSYQDGRD